MAELSLEELQRFSYKLVAIPSIVTFLLNFFGLTVVGILVSVAIHLIILGVFFLLFKEFKSAFLKFIFVALIMCFIGEVLDLFNSGHVKYEGVYWGFMGIHFARNIILSLAFFWNIWKSHIFNELWVKALPYIIVIPLTVIVQFLVFGQEELYPLIFLIYNISLGLSLLTASLRYSHTSDKSYFIMVLAMMSFYLSEIFYFLEFLPDNTGSIIQDLRTPFLQLASCLMVSGTVDHVIHHKLTVKQRIYLPLTDKESNVLRGKAAPSVVKNIITVGKKPLQEPLI